MKIPGSDRKNEIKTKKKRKTEVPLRPRPAKSDIVKTMFSK